MRTATITEAKNGLSALIDHVRTGESVLIMDRGRPVARLEPAVSAGEDPGGRLSRLERAGIIRVAQAEPPIDLIVQRPPRSRGRGGAVKALLDERSEGR